jgi:DNA-binding FadR family transcriptional regulator
MSSLRGPALNQIIRDYIKQYIFEHGLNGGDPLPPETRLAQDLGVGRSSVREAIKALQSLGIVEVRQGDGLYVREYNFDPVLETLSYGMRFDTTTLAELAQIRIWLEAALVEEAVKQITPQKVAQLEAVIQQWADRAAKNLPGTDLDERFHRLLYETLNNQTLIKLLEVFWIAFENFEVKTTPATPQAVTLEQHQAILEAIKAGDAPLTRQRLLRHFHHLQEKIRRATDSSQTV